MKYIKKSLKIFGLTLLIILILLAGLVTLIIQKPEAALEWAGKYFLPKDMKVTWSELHLGFISIDTTNLCIYKKEPLTDFCFNRFVLKSDINFSILDGAELKIHHLLLESRYQNKIALLKSDAKQSKSEKNFYQIVETFSQGESNFLRNLKIENVRIDLPSIEIRQPRKTKLVFSVWTKSENFLDEAPVKIKLENYALFEGDIQGWLYLHNFLTGEGVFADLNSQFIMPWGEVELQALRVRWKKENMSMIAKGNTKLDSGPLVKHNLALLLSPQELSVEAHLNLSKLADFMTGETPLALQAHIPLEQDQLWPSEEEAIVSARSEVPLYFVSSSMRPPLEEACQCKIPEKLGVKFYAHFNLYNLLANQAPGTLGQARLEVDSLSNGLFSLEGQLFSEFVRTELGPSFIPQGKVHLKINSFQGLANFLNSQNIMIPAPIASMDGSIALDINDHFQFGDVLRIPYQLKVNLSSTTQKVNITNTGKVSYYPERRLVFYDSKFQVHNLTLELPPLQPIKGLPKLVRDSRFKMRPEPRRKNKQRPINFVFNIDVNTLKEPRIHLLSNLANPFVPIDLSLNMHSARGLQGQVRLAEFDIEYLRRKSSVEKLSLSLNQAENVIPVDGRFRIDQNPYKIYIDILGPLQRPQIQLSSDPYLPRSDIISVLLYGRPSEDLVSSDRDTVGSFEAAMADRALGLFGIWAFSSTPIQSFSYNQLSQEYTARVSLADDTTVTLGTDWESATSFEVQKRISRRWMISTSMEPTEDDESLQKVRLQWENRF